MTEIVTDSAGVSVRYAPLRDVRPGDEIASGWKPWLVVESVEPRDDGMARMRFVGGHLGEWEDALASVPVIVGDASAT